MADQAGQFVASLAYNSVTTTTTPTNLPYEIKQTTVAGKSKDELWLTTASGTLPVAQVFEFALSGTVASGDVVHCTITDADNNVRKYMTEAHASDTLTTLAAALAASISVDDDVVATSSAGTITVTSATPGRAFTAVTGKSGTVAISAGSNTTANSGTAKKRKIAEVELDYATSTDGFLTVTGTVKFFGGENNPSTPAQTQATAAYKHPKSIDALRATA